MRLLILSILLALGLVGPAIAGTAPRDPHIQLVADSVRPVHVMLPRGVTPNVVSGQAGTNMTYHGGLIQSAPNIYIVFWHYGKDPAHMQPRLTAFMGAIGNSPWLATVDQYYDLVNGNQTYINTSNNKLLGVWNDNSRIPRHPTDAQIQAEAVKAAIHFGNINANNDYIVATEHRHSSRGFKSQYCAYHGFTTANGVNISYTNMPYIPDAGAGCGANSVNAGPSGLLDGVSIVGGHEVAESMTDAFENAWYNNSGEIGDLCAWQGLKNTTFGVQVFPTQPLWSNLSIGCIQ